MGVSRIPTPRLCRAILPMLGAEFLVFLLVRFVPAVSLWLPGLLGYTR